MEIKITFFKKLLILPCFIISWNTYASEPEYDLQTAREYLSSINHIAVVLKVKGEMSLGGYVGLVSSYADKPLNENELEVVWKKEIAIYDNNDFVVLKNIKGDLGRMIRVPSGTENVQTVPLGEPTLMFIQIEKDNYGLGVCGIFPASEFPNSILKNGTEKDLIDFIIDKRLSPCLGKIEGDPEIQR